MLLFSRDWPFCNTMDCSPPGSSVHEIFQTRILEWAAIPFLEDLPDQRIKPTSPARTSCISGSFFTTELSRKPRCYFSYNENHKMSWESPWKWQLTQTSIYFHFPILKLDSPFKQTPKNYWARSRHFLDYCTNKIKWTAIQPFMKKADLVQRLIWFCFTSVSKREKGRAWRPDCPDSEQRVPSLERQTQNRSKY